MFSVAIHSHCVKEKMYKFKMPRKNQHWVYSYHSNLKVGPFSPPPVALGLHIVPCGKFHRIGGAPPETFSSEKYDAPEEVGGDRKSFDSPIRK